MKLFPKDAPSVVGVWAQPKHLGWFQDVNITYFLERGVTNYKQNGEFILVAFDPTLNFAEKFKQDG